MPGAADCSYFLMKEGFSLDQTQIEREIKSLVNVPHQFSFENGVTITKVEHDLCEGELAVGPDSINPGGYVHGGALVTLADTVAGCCACSRGGDCVTANESFEFLRTAGGPKIFCRAVPKKMGRTLRVIQVELTDSASRTVATGTFTFFMTEV